MKKKLYSILILLALLLTIAPAGAKTARKPLPFIISGHVEKVNADSLTLFVWYDILSDSKRFNNPFKIYKAHVKNGRFYIKTDPLGKAAYISLSYDKTESGHPKTYFDKYIVEPGDDIVLSEYKRNGRVMGGYYFDTTCIDCSSIKFRGRGSAKMNCQWELDERQRENFKVMDTMNDRNSPDLLSKVKLNFRDMQILEQGDMDLLQRYKKLVSPAILQIIKADAIAADHFYFYNSGIMSGIYRNPSSDTLQLIQRFYDSKADEWKRYYTISPTLLLKSAGYSRVAIRKAGFEKVFFDSGKTRYDFVKHGNQGALQQQLLTKYLFEDSKIASYDSLVNDAIKIVSDTGYKMILYGIKKRMFAGSEAYNFALPDSLGNIIRLSDFKGKVVLIDFFFTGCTGCSYYFEHTLSKAEEHFKGNKDVVFITIAIDRKDIWYKGLKSGEYTSGSAINLYTGNQGSAHPIIKHYMVYSYPNPLLISRKGTVISNDAGYLGLGEGNEGRLISALNKALSSK